MTRKLWWPVLLTLALILALAGCQNAPADQSQAQPTADLALVTAQPFQTAQPSPSRDPKGNDQEVLEENNSQEALEENGHYDSQEDVALYLHLYGQLPDNYITKNEARDLGWTGGSVERYAPGMCIGGDRFSNREGQLPEKNGRTWTECDVDTLGESSRGAKRIVYSNDGLIYYTDDHYENFQLLYGEP